VIDQAIDELVPLVGVRAACQAVGRPRGSHYRQHRQSPPPPKPERVASPQPRALSGVERKEVLGVLHDPEHVDEAPATVYAKLLDQGVYLASTSTMYRILRAEGEVTERRRQATHPATVKPELLAVRPNAVWSWDITKLLGPAKWTWFYLYVILDIYSRYVPGWMLARAERAHLAERLLGGGRHHRQAARHPPAADHPRRSWHLDGLHAGRLPAGRPRRHQEPQPAAHQQRQSLQREPVQDPQAPARVPRPVRLLGGRPRLLHPVLRLVQPRHRHSGIGFHTPADVHYGRAELVHAQRATVLDAAYAAHPERFVRKPPIPPQLPTAAWINKPKEDTPGTTNP
jgi:putative transposase